MNCLRKTCALTTIPKSQKCWHDRRVRICLQLVQNNNLGDNILRHTVLTSPCTNGAMSYIGASLQSNPMSHNVDFSLLSQQVLE